MQKMNLLAVFNKKLFFTFLVLWPSSFLLLFVIPPAFASADKDLQLVQENCQVEVFIQTGLKGPFAMNKEGKRVELFFLEELGTERIQKVAEVYQNKKVLLKGDLLVNELGELQLFIKELPEPAEGSAAKTEDFKNNPVDAE